jgi:phospholipid/cholesterol/gamma-HCH transport system substrate-binding protein
MKNNRNTEIKVGITVLLGLIVFIWILGWTKNFTFTSSDHKVKVKFDNVSGLEIGNDVTVNGVKKGHVQDFNVDKNSVIVILSVNNEVQLMKDATFNLEMTDLMGGRKIDINPGSSIEPMDLEVVQAGIYRTDIAGLVTALGDFQGNVEIIIKEATEVLQGINVFVKDETFKNDIKQGISNLNKVSLKLDEVLSENQQNLKEITQNTKELTSETKTFIKENNETLQRTLKNLDVVMTKSDSLLTTLNQLSQETVSGKNNLGKILYDDSLYINLMESVKTLKQLSKTFLEQIENDGLKVDAYIF